MTSLDDPVGRNLAQHDQMVSGLAQIGRIVEPGDGDPTKPEHGTPMALVHVGGEEKGTFTRTWMPWLAHRAGCDAEWWMPDIEEQVLILAPSGNPSQGIVIGSIYRGDRLNHHDVDDLKSEPGSPHQIPDGEKAGPVPGLGRQSHLRVYRDGTSASYDREKHKYDFQIRADPEKETILALSAQLGSADGEAAAELRLGKTSEPLATLRLNVSGEKGEIEISALETVSIKVGDTSCSIAKDDITMTAKKIELKGDSTTLTISADGVNAT